MSYDYNALVESIFRNRREAAEKQKLEKKGMLKEEEEGNNNNDNSSSSGVSDSLQQAIQALETLSGHCPMTPLLWIIYGKTVADFVESSLPADGPEQGAEATAADQMKMTTVIMEEQILQLGLEEFPGSLLLHQRYTHLLQAKVQLFAANNKNNNSDDDNTTDNNSDEQDAVSSYRHALHDATGHLSAHAISVDHIYFTSLVQQAAVVTLSTNDNHPPNDDASLPTPPQQLQQLQQALAYWVQLARLPGHHENLSHTFHEFCRTQRLPSTTHQQEQQQHISEALQRMEEARRWGAKLWSEVLRDVIPPLEQLMEQGSLTLPHSVALPEGGGSNNVVVNWSLILDPVASPVWKLGMGYGDESLAQAFLRYAHAVEHLYRKHSNATKQQQQQQQEVGDGMEERQNIFQGMPQLIVSIYERAVSECPTVENLWLAYLDFLQQQQQDFSSKRDVRSDASTQKSHDADSTAVQQRQEAARKWARVATRAQRNCPYSRTLVQRRLEGLGLLAECNVQVLDPDALEEVVTRAWDAQFLVDATEHATTKAIVWVDLHIGAIRILKQRILWLLMVKSLAGTWDFDQAIDVSNKKIRKQLLTLVQETVEDGTLVEIQDLCDEIQEAFLGVDEKLVQTFKNAASPARARLLREQALTEAHILQPLQKLGEENVEADEGNDKVLALWERTAKIETPANPDHHWNYIRQFLAAGAPLPQLSTSLETPSLVSNPVCTVLKLCHARHLFQRAVTLSGRPKHNQKNSGTRTETMGARSFESSLQTLISDWFEFENVFGSPRSRTAASEICERKLSKLGVAAPTKFSLHTFQSTEEAQEVVTGTVQSDAEGASEHVERDAHQRMSMDRTTIHPETRNRMGQPDHDLRIEEVAEDMKSNQSDKKRPCDDDESEQQPKRAKLGTEHTEEAEKVKLKKKDLPKVKIGHLEYPAHPFTIRVSNLADGVEDMELVTLFRKRCGAVVHARILRDKQTHISKGWALVQFEEKSTVDTALSLDDTVGLHETIIRIERSHIPAVGLVPSGRQQNTKSQRKDSRKQDMHNGTKKLGDKQSGGQSDTLSFRPRSVTSRKARLSLKK